MKKILITLGFLLMTVVTLISCVDTENVPFIASWTNTSLSNKMEDNRWELSAKSCNGHATRNLDFHAHHLEALHVESTVGGGEAYLIISQDDTEKSIDITGEFNENIDMIGFGPGRIRLRLEFKRAENIDIIINWE